MLFYALWSRTFYKTDQEHRASIGLQGGRTQAGGALGGEPQDKGPKSQRHKKKKQEGVGAEDQSGNKSFGGAGLRRKEDTTKSGGKNKVVPGQRAKPTPPPAVACVMWQARPPLVTGLTGVHN